MLIIPVLPKQTTVLPVMNTYGLSLKVNSYLPLTNLTNSGSLQNGKTPVFIELIFMTCADTV